MSKNKKILSKQRQDFLRTFFKQEGYQEIEVNGFWLVKVGGGKEEVMIYSPESFKRYKEHGSNQLSI